MHPLRLILCATALSLGLLGCSSPPTGEASPTVRLLRGDLGANQFAGAVTAANTESRAAEQFEVNRVPTRAYNTTTGRYEYLPEDTQQRWNEAEKRWEFTPVSR